MIEYTTGNLLESSAEALVNTVNCEGYMGKGLAYQFKLRYPKNNESYKKASKKGQLNIGRMFVHEERNKIIINFPTKKNWRRKSKIEYIEKGLEDLKKFLVENNIKTVAIPPLGSGNGGLIWKDVKELIEKQLQKLPRNIRIIIYEPTQNYSANPFKEPVLNTSALLLMEIKRNLKTFNKTRLQKTAFIMDYISGKNYFHFKKYKLGPYDNGINIISKKINEFQNFHQVKEIDKAYDILIKKITSEKVTRTISYYKPYLKRAACFVNSIETNKELECIATVLYLMSKENKKQKEEIITGFRNWSTHKSQTFTERDIDSAIEKIKAIKKHDNTQKHSA